MSKDTSKDEPKVIVTDFEMDHDAARNFHEYQYAVFPHYDILYSSDPEPGASPPPQLGHYFASSRILNLCLSEWGKNGWHIPNIVVSWEQIKSGTHAGHWAYRVRNAGAPVVAGGKMSVVVAVRKLSARQPQSAQVSLGPSEGVENTESVASEPTEEAVPEAAGKRLKHPPAGARSGRRGSKGGEPR